MITLQAYRASIGRFYNKGRDLGNIEEFKLFGFAF